MSNFDENINFKQGSDTGQANAASTQPIAVAEPVWPDVANRPLENLRVRTETLRRNLQNVLYYLDYNHLVLRSDALFTLTEPTAGNFELAMSGDDLWVYPALTPGRQSGGRLRGGRVYVNGLPYSGVALVNDLTLTATSQFTGQRGYFDGDSFNVSTVLTLGANRLEVDLIADGALVTGVVQFTVTQNPATKVTIRYGTSGGATSLSALMTAINGDLTSQGGLYGVANIFRATSTAASPGSVSPTPFTGGKVQGGYDAEAHQVTTSQLAAFFAATESGVQVNRLKEGEGLAVGYPIGPVETGVAVPKGGRRQSIWDLPTSRAGALTTNITPVSGWSIFSTGREPEKIPGAVPIGKMINGQFVFTDGTRLAVGQSLKLGESTTTLANLASQVFSSSGASLVGYDGSGAWNNDAAASSNPNLAPGTLDASLDALVADLAREAVSQSGGRRVGLEPIAGSATTGNVALSLVAGSLRESIDAAMNTVGSSTTAGGVNARVSEFGHSLHGLKPIEKDLAETTPENISAGGGVVLRALTDHGSSVFTDARPYATSVETLEKIAFNLGAGSILLADSTVTGVTGGNTLVLSGFLANAVNVKAILNAALENAPGGTPLYFIKARLTGCNISALNGWYWLENIDTVAGGMTLVTLANTVPNFAGVTTGTLSIYQGPIMGNQGYGQKLVGFHANDVTSPMIELATVQGSAGALMRFWNQDNMPNPGAIFYGNAAIWRPAATTPRSTNNIPGTADKALLDGVETGVVVDATTNHHHGANYSRTNYVNTVAIAVSSLGTVGAGLGTSVTLLGVVPAGYRRLGVFVTVQISYDYTTTLGQNVQPVFYLGTPVPAAGDLEHSETHLNMAAAAPGKIAFQFSGFVAVEQSGSYDQVLIVRQDGPQQNGTSNWGASTITITEVAQVLYHT